jgi:hypothetical protein
MGMNTSDIRVMETGQWVFWAVAIPLTATVITLCLFCTGRARDLKLALLLPWLRIRYVEDRGVVVS